MSSTELNRIDNKLECPRCHTIYLALTQNVSSYTPIHCSSCATYLGTWRELEADFFAQGGCAGIFEMHDGQIIRRA